MYTIESNESGLFERSKSEWLFQAGQVNDDIGVMITDDVEGIFEWVTREADHTYFLVKDGAGYGCAILKILHARPSSEDSWLKLLKIHIEPKLNLDDDGVRTAQKVNEVVDVLGWSILESIRFTFINGVNKLKVFGRTNIMTAMFAALLANKDLVSSFSSSGLSVRQEGRWLVVEKQ